MEINGRLSRVFWGRMVILKMRECGVGGRRKEKAVKEAVVQSD